MRINNNIASLNTQGRLNASQTAMSKSLERLSSGLRIGKASDDAAGLGISEKMRGQIKGLDRAQKNASEAISLLQTAEGALNESHSILQRMRELAGQAASDTATATDRSEMQKEVDQLTKELTRITNTTQFNTKNLLGGAFTGQKFQVGANTGQDIELAIGAMDAFSLGVTASKGATIVDGTALTSGTLSAGSAIASGRYSVDMSVASADFDELTGVGQSAAVDGASTVFASANSAGNGFTVSGKAGVGYAAVKIAEADVGATPTFAWDAASKTLTINAESGTTTGANVATEWGKWVTGDGALAHDALSLAVQGSGASQVTANDIQTKALSSGTTTVFSGANGFTASGSGTVKMVESAVGNAVTFAWDQATSTLTINAQAATTTGADVAGDYATWVAGAGAAAGQVITIAQNGTGAGTVGAAETSAAGVKTVLKNATDKGTFSVTSLTSGTSGVSFELDNTGAVGSSPTISVTNSAIKVTVAKTGSTLQSIVDAINNDANASTLVKAEITGGIGGAMVTGSKAATSLAGGTTATVDLTLKDEGGQVVEKLASQSIGSVINFNNGLSVNTNDTFIKKQQEDTSLGTIQLDVVAANSKAAVSVGNGNIATDATVEKGILVNTQANAGAALAVLDKAINTVSSARSNLGAIQNRLEHTMGNLGVTQENMMAAESRIRDVDMAKEMSEFTKNQILGQAATAMLAQANQVPQGVLKLLG